MRGAAALVPVLLALAASRAASAEPLDVGAGQAPPPAVEAARTGAASPLLLAATLGSRPALVIGHGGYDTARSGALFDSAAEVRIWGPLAIRAGVAYSDDQRRMRPSVGARLQLMRQSAHGIDGTLSAFYKAEGLNEVEGEIETILALGRRFDAFYLLANLAYGQDPEGNERDGELRISALKPLGRGVLGLEARGRSAIGAAQSASAAREPRLDLASGGIGMVALGSFVLFAEVGPSAVRFQGSDARWGVASLGGLLALF
jgi:hypothetical protein